MYIVKKKLCTLKHKILLQYKHQYPPFIFVIIEIMRFHFLNYAKYKKKIIKGIT